MRADVALGGRAEECVANSVRQDVGVRMALEPELERYLDAPEDELAEAQAKARAKACEGRLETINCIEWLELGPIDNEHKERVNRKRQVSGQRGRKAGH